VAEIFGGIGSGSSKTARASQNNFGTIGGKMERYSGVFELGEAVVTTLHKRSIIEYSYISTGDKYLRNLRVLSGLNGKLEAAVRNSEEIELFVAERCVLGVRFANGKVFASNWGGIGLAPTIAGSLVCILLVFTVFGAPFGIFAGIYIANAGRCGRLTRKAASVSGAVLI
jgi:hypothetical protein